MGAPRHSFLHIDELNASPQFSSTPIAQENPRTSRSFLLVPCMGDVLMGVFGCASLPAKWETFLPVSHFSASISRSGQAERPLGERVPPPPDQTGGSPFFLLSCRYNEIRDYRSVCAPSASNPPQANTLLLLFRQHTSLHFPFPHIHRRVPKSLRRTSDEYEAQREEGHRVSFLRVSRGNPRGPLPADLPRSEEW